MEIERYIKISVNDLMPSNVMDYQLQFDELGILKQVNLSLMNMIVYKKFWKNWFIYVGTCDQDIENFLILKAWKCVWIWSE